MTARLRSLAIVAVVGVLLVACDIAPEPTPIPTSTPLPTPMPASPTVAPVLPTALDAAGGNVEDRNFTPGAPAVSTINPEVTVTPTPAPTESAIVMQFPAGDGVTVVGTYYGAPSRPAPTVLLLHEAGGNKETWGLFAVQLQQAGHNVLAIDLRGHGATGGKVDWGKATQDIGVILGRLRTLPGVDRRRISIVGASIGANLALASCADFQECKYIVLFSPRLDQSGIKAADAIVRYGNRPMLIIASRGDIPGGADSMALDRLAQGDHKLQLLDGTASGLSLLGTQSGLAGQVVEWMKAHNP